MPSDWRPEPGIRRLNRLAGITGAETYLQLGWLSHAAFTKIEVAHRDVVDGEFLFDVRSYRNQGAQFYEVALDQFLTWFAKGRAYDLVMLDNQHDWREALDTVRTVFASAAHDRTVVVLNLTAAGDRTVWSSDVAKTVLALHDLHPELEFRTIANDGDAQTVIWRRGRTARPRFDTENEIGALTAAEMARHRSLSATVPEDKAMAEVQGWLHPRPPRRLARMARRVGGWRRRGPER